MKQKMTESEGEICNYNHGKLNIILSAINRTKKKITMYIDGLKNTINVT